MFVAVEASKAEDGSGDVPDVLQTHLTELDDKGPCMLARRVRLCRVVGTYRGDKKRLEISVDASLLEVFDAVATANTCDKCGGGYKEGRAMRGGMEEELQWLMQSMW